MIYLKKFNESKKTGPNGEYLIPGTGGGYFRDENNDFSDFKAVGIKHNIIEQLDDADNILNDDDFNILKLSIINYIDDISNSRKIQHKLKK